VTAARVVTAIPVVGFGIGVIVLVVCAARLALDRDLASTMRGRGALDA